MNVVIVDYGMGNLGSVRRALEQLGAEPEIATDPARLEQAERIILPGVGSFADGMAHLDEHGWSAALRARAQRGTPLLGICLGMQLLATHGTERGQHAGLGLIPGRVTRLDLMGCQARIPHVGWNDIKVTAAADNAAGRLFEGIADGTDFYFVHSFAFEAERPGDVLASVDYGIEVAAAVGRGHIAGTQFHPEKSSKAGFRILKNFLEAEAC
ncbi:MAG: imidazole glycerol phosphate synthase subunit HisH [Burkholderiaceae bacterium]|nr:imidazole glycerol phosphate synthase subunit HisH [Burkholderiaceae bacterium]